MHSCDDGDAAPKILDTLLASLNGQQNTAPTAETQDMQAREDVPTRMFGGDPDSTYEPLHKLHIHGDGLRHRINTKFRQLEARFALMRRNTSESDLRVLERLHCGLRRSTSEPDLRADPRPDTFHNLRGLFARRARDVEEDKNASDHGTSDGNFFTALTQLQTIKAKRLAARASQEMATTTQAFLQDSREIIVDSRLEHGKDTLVAVLYDSSILCSAQRAEEAAKAASDDGDIHQPRLPAPLTEANVSAALDEVSDGTAQMLASSVDCFWHKRMSAEDMLNMFKSVKLQSKMLGALFDTSLCAEAFDESASADDLAFLMGLSVAGNQGDFAELKIMQ